MRAHAISEPLVNGANVKIDSLNASEGPLDIPLTLPLKA